MKQKKPKHRIELDPEIIADLDGEQGIDGVKGGVSKFNCTINSAPPTQTCFACSGGL